jgi:hypothetical protein
MKEKFIQANTIARKTGHQNNKTMTNLTTEQAAAALKSDKAGGVTRNRSLYTGLLRDLNPEVSISIRNVGTVFADFSACITMDKGDWIELPAIEDVVLRDAWDIWQGDIFLYYQNKHDIFALVKNWAHNGVLRARDSNDVAALRLAHEGNPNGVQLAYPMDMGCCEVCVDGDFETVYYVEVRIVDDRGGEHFRRREVPKDRYLDILMGNSTIPKEYLRARNTAPTETQS